MVLGQYQPFWWNSFSLFGYVEDSPFWIVSDHFCRLKSANLGWSSCLNEFVSLVDTSKWQFYCGKGDITLSQFEIYRYLFCVRSPWKSRMVDSSMTKKANCRSKGKILWTSQLQLPCGPSFGRSPGIDSGIPAGSRLCDIRSIPGLQSYSSLPLQGTTESFLAKTGQHGALFGWYLIWATLLARHSWALSFLKAEVQLFNRCSMAAVFCCS